MRKKHKRNKKVKGAWGNIKAIGNHCSLAERRVKNILVRHKLMKRDGIVTEKAIREEYARPLSPYIGKPKVTWNIDKVTEIVLPSLEKSAASQTKAFEVENYVRNILPKIKMAYRRLEKNESEKEYDMLDGIFNEVPKHLRRKVQEKVIKELKREMKI
jgi:hypothetical protein